jgi:hypothetical protein
MKGWPRVPPKEQFIKTKLRACHEVSAWSG